jgi:hypothetical protein
MRLLFLLGTLLSMSKSSVYPGLSEPKYIIIFENGRLGNQFFQYLAARTAAPRAQIVFIGLQSLLVSLQSCSSSIAPSRGARLLEKLFGRLGRKRALVLAKRRRLWSVISEIRDGDNVSISFAQGLCNKIALLDGFFQDETIFEHTSLEKFPLRIELLDNAREWIESNVVSRGFNPYFLHLRRGDYVRWPTGDHPAVLPFQWYEQQMNEIAQADSRAHFVVCTDDRPYAEERLGSNPMVSIFRGSEIDDFFLMTQCSAGGILSASTFSWWAAWYGKHFFGCSRYIAPQYWAGWRLREWYPPAIETTWLDYRAVN